MESNDSDGDDAGRGYARILLVACCLLAVVLAGGLVPALTAGPSADSPIESVVPGSELAGGPEALPGTDSPASGPTAGSGFGALNPGDVTDAGGDPGVPEAGLRSQSSTVHFTVRSSAPAYWRTATYDEYTGTGWRRTGEPTPYRGPVETEGIDGQRVEYEVRLNRTATAVPTVWRPRTVAGLDSLMVTDGNALGSADALAPGTAYRGVSHKPPRDPDVLRASGRSYPAAIERRYTRLGDVPRRVGYFTEDLTANASTPYETARTVERWLESEKGYSLNVSTDAANMADRFIFGMEAGYCEYFATSMVVMLRTQGIPARYVVGYSTGQQVGENTYRVRGMNAHAWVEVYFEDAGWVKFDPTPGGARLQQERQSLRDDQPGQEYDPVEEGSPGEEFSPDSEPTPTAPETAAAPATPTPGTASPPTPDEPGTTPGGTPTTPIPGDTDPEGTSYDVTLNRTAVPGATVAATVTRDGEPAPDRVVAFNGDPVGTTDGDGKVTGTVPYATELRITVAAADRESIAGLGAGTGVGLDRLGSPQVAPAPEDLTVPVETNATVAVSGERIPGGPVTLTATVDGVPARGATVSLDGLRVATTGDRGRAQFELPTDPGNYTVAVEREPIRGQTTVAVPAVDLSVTPQAPLALPLTGATVEVTAGDRSLSGVPVRVDGREVATTGFNGTAAIGFPLAPSATVAISGPATEQSVTVSLFLNLLLALAAVGLAVGGPLAVLARRGYGPRRLLGGLGRLPGRAVQAAQWLLVTLATRGDELPAVLAARLRTTVEYLHALASGRTTLAGLRERLLAWLREHRRRARGDPATMDPGSDPDDALDEPRRAIRAAWRRFLGTVSLGRVQNRTPGEIARHAVRTDGLPADPVRHLRDAVREVEYGGRPATERVERVREALTAIERAADERPRAGTDGDGEPASDRAAGDGEGD